MYKLILILFFSFSIYGETLTLSLIKDTPKDAKNFYGSLGKLEKKEYMTGLGILASTYLLTNFDDDIKSFKDKHENKTLDNLSPIFRKFGEFYPPLILFTVGQFTNNEKAIKTGFYSAEAALLGVGVTYIGKNLFARARPSTAEGSNSWNNERFNSDYSSFPSGHSTIAFATATVIAEMYKNEKGVPELMYTLASLAALSRIYDDKHWFSDIVLGSSIGYFSGKLLLNLKEKDGFIGPQSNGNSIGLVFGGQF